MHINLHPTWQWSGETSNLIGAAIHDGHNIRDELSAHLALDEAGRLREEDPFTGPMARVLPFHVIGSQSRFEIDFNRPAAKAVYRLPADAWGLQVWHGELPDEIAQRSLELYQAFYADAEKQLKAIEAQFGNFVVFDIHSYNHRRDGADGAPAAAHENPEVNIGTASLGDEKFRPLVESLISDLRAFDFQGRHLDVRENVKFKGGEFSQWIHRTFPRTGCSIAIEWKKFWMDEWTGEPDQPQLELICRATQSTLAGVKAELARLSL